MAENSVLNDILKRVAIEHGITFALARKIFEAPFLFTSSVIKSAERGKHETFKNVMIPSLGKFYAKKKDTIDAITNNRKKKEERGDTKRKYVLINSIDNNIPKITENDN